MRNSINKEASMKRIYAILVTCVIFVPKMSWSQDYIYDSSSQEFVRPMAKLAGYTSTENIKVVGRWPYLSFSTMTVAVQDEYIYSGLGGGIFIYYYRYYRLVGRYVTSGIVKDLFVSGDYLYVAAGDAGLRVIDVSDPSNPKEVGYCDTPGEAVGVYVSGSFAYVAAGDAGLRVIDVSDPSNPKEVGYYNASVREIHVSGSYAYVIHEEELLVIDVSDPSDPKSVGYYYYGGGWNYLARPVGVYILGSYAYIIYEEEWTLEQAIIHPPPEGGSLCIIDISDPSNLKLVGSCSTYVPQGIYVSGSFAYVAAGDAGLRVIDVSDLSNPKEVGSLDITLYNEFAIEVQVSNSRAYVVDLIHGLRVIDVSDPSNPEKITELGYGVRQASGIYVSGSYAYVAYMEVSRYHLILAPPIEILKEPSVFVFFQPYFRYKCYVYIGFDYGGIYVIDISDPSNPFDPFDEIPLFSGVPYRVGVSESFSGSYICVAAGELNVIKPSAQRAVVLDTPGKAVGVYVSGSFAYVAAFE